MERTFRISVAIFLLCIAACGTESGNAGTDTAVAADTGGGGNGEGLVGGDTGAGGGGTTAAGCDSDDDCAPWNDGNACNGSLRCDVASGHCQVDPKTVVACDPKDDTACVRATCAPLTGACALQPALDGLHCDDGDPCTSGDHCKLGACAPGAVAVCECKSNADCPDADENLCTGVSYCDQAVAPYRCRPKPASAITCKQGLDPCSVATCEPQTGACKSQPVADGGTCDDGNPCTKGDQCLKGACSGGADTCKCKIDTDCEDDGNLCNGIQFCDKTDNGGTCKPNPATVINCNDQADSTCLKNTCVPALGTCKLSATSEGKTCDDANTCTTGETCVGGACTAGTDTCKCNTNADCAGKEDGNFCNGTMFCNKQTGGCELNPATIVTCPTVNDTACAKNVCVPASGKCEVYARAAVNQIGCQAVDLGGGIVAQFCLFAPPSAGNAADPGPFGCEDGEKCTTGDVCDGKVCKPGAKVCDCATDADCASKDDGNLCNGTQYCDPVAGKCAVNPATVVTCQSVDDTACSKNTCNPKSGQCSYVVQPGGTPCDDGDACTSGDSCAQGKCATGKFTCECKADADCIDVDGDLCTGTFYCDKSGSKPVCKLNAKSVVVCPGVDDTACLKNVCNPKLGACQPTAAAPGSLCDDGEPCTKGDVCKLGSCVPGTFSCECKVDADCASKEDGNLCNGTLICDKSGPAPACKPKPNSVVSCPSVDDTQCSKNTCNVKSGLCGFIDLPTGAKCDDGELCTAGDSCYQGKCAAGTFTCACKSDSDCISKEDGNFCNGTLFCDTTGATPACKVKENSIVTCPNVDDTACIKNTCQPKTGGCQAAQVSPGTVCDDGDACTKGDTCKLGACAPGAFTCECKADADCAAKDDGNLCNGLLYCDKTGAAPACKALPNSSVFCSKVDDTTCLKAACDAKTGKCALQPVAVGTPCDDGATCTVNEVCGGGNCGGGAGNPCNDSNGCTVDSCDPATGCKHVAKACDDGNECTSEGCDTKTGNCTAPVAIKAGALCNADADGCTAGDVCDGKGICKAGTVVNCQASQNPCEQALCVAKGNNDYACATTKRPDGSACDDDASCNIGAVCKAGACQPATLPTLYGTPTAPNLPAIGAATGFTVLRDVASLPGRDVGVAGQRRAKVGDAATTNKAFVSRYDATLLAERMRWSVEFAGAVASDKTAAVALSAVGDDLVVASDLALANGVISADLRRLDSAGKTLWTAASANLAWAVPGNANPGAAGRVLAVSANANGTIALALAPVVAKGATLDGQVQTAAHEVFRVVIAGVDGSKASEWLRVPAEVWGPTTIDRGDLRWNGTIDFDFTATLRATTAANKIYNMATAARISASGATVIPGALEAIYGLNTDDLGGKEGFVGQVLARDGSGRTVRGRLREQSPDIVDGLFERTDAQGVNPLRFDTKLVGEPTRIARLGEEWLAFGGVLASDTGVAFGAMDGRGNLVWSRSIVGAAWRFAGLAVDAQQNLLVAASETKGGTSYGRVLRLDAFGHESCAAAGACIGKTSDACVDGDACTRDGCDGQTGCTHLATDALACDPNNGCSSRAVCSAGACKQDEQGRLFTTVSDIGISLLSQPYADDKLGICWLNYQSAGNTLPPTRLCLPVDKGPLPLDTNTAPSAACNNMAALDESIQESVEAIPAAPGGVPGCVRAGDAFVSGKLGHRATFTIRSPQWNFDYNNCALTSCDEKALAMHRTPAGAAWGVHYDTPALTGPIRVRRLTKASVSSATSAATVTFARATVGAYAASAARLDDGLLLATTLPVSGNSQGRLTSITTTAATLYQASAAVAGRDVIAYAVAPIADGGAVVVGQATADGALVTSWRWRVNKSGQTLWSKTPSSPDGVALVAVRPLAGHILAVGGKQDNANYSGLLVSMRYDTGVSHFERGLGPSIAGFGSNWARVVDLPDGGYGVLWRRFNGSYNRVAVTRTDGFGHPTCTAAGGCANKSLVDCDDGIACNVDGCDGKTGKCTHDNFASTAPCGVSGVCNVSASCIE